MLENNTKVTKLGCFGSFTCYNKTSVICINCKYSEQCSKLAQERYAKLANILKVENDLNRGKK